MNKYESLAITIIFLVVSFISSAQVAVGQWQDHFSYNNGKQIIVVDNTIYMISENGILKYNKDNSEIEKLTKLNYLSDITPSAIAYDEQTKNIIIGYSSGNIDLIHKNEITNINDIKKKNINSSKTINSIIAKNGIAYIGCDFGIVTIDIKRVEVKETWFFGNNGSYVHVNDMDFNDNDIYVATTTGVYKGNIDENLVDFSKWTELSDAEQPPLAWMKGGNYNTLKYFQDKLIVNYKSPQENNDTIMAYDGTTWTHVINDRRFTNNISGNNDTLICSTGSALYTYGRNLESTGEYWFYKTEYSWINTNATHAIIYDDKIWIADKENGLCWIKDNTGGIIDINSPQSNKVFDISSSKSRIMAVNGGYISSLVPTWKSLQLYIYENYEWKTKTTSNFPELAEMTDFVSITFDPNDEKRYFLCSWTKGLVEFRQDQFYKSYNETNSTMVPIDGSEMIRTGSAAFDGNGNLWVTNSLASKCLHVMTKDGRWTGFSFPNMVKNITKLIVTSSGKKWMVLGQSGGLFVFDDNGTPEDKTDDRYKHLTVCNENGETVSNDVYSIAEDKNGYIWVGTAKGVVVYYNPDKVFDNSTFWGRQIKVPRNDGTDNADILLSADVVTAICVDGANNKWFGTQNGGAYYTSSDGIETIHNFNTTNSAIPSDNILAISIVPETGDVFFATPKGIISYRGTATEGSETYDEILAFPNPVRSDYYGPITIKGLVAGSIVKIADIAGNIVYEAKSTGGQLVWDGRNLNGNRVASGVYIVFASTEIGEQKSTTKILFLK
jgi:ligand-binding sensor domain-containing protein